MKSKEIHVERRQTLIKKLDSRNKKQSAFWPICGTRTNLNEFFHGLVIFVGDSSIYAASVFILHEITWYTWKIMWFQFKLFSLKKFIIFRLLEIFYFKTRVGPKWYSTKKIEKTSFFIQNYSSQHELCSLVAWLAVYPHFEPDFLYVLSTQQFELASNVKIKQIFVWKPKDKSKLELLF